jgi:hypothetical protein
VPRIWKGAPRKLDVAGRDQPADVGGRHDLAVELDQARHARLEAALGREQRRVAAGAVAEAEVLPDRDPVGVEPLDQHTLDELLGRLARERAVERDHDELAHAEAADQVGLDVQGREELGRGVGRDDGARVRLEGEHGVGAADDLAVADVDAVELADGEVARARPRVGEPGDLRGSHQ